MEQEKRLSRRVTDHRLIRQELMPEVLQNGGLYFDPEKTTTTCAILETLIADSYLRKTLARQAKQLANKYFWERCGKETFSFLAKTAKAALP